MSTARRLARVDYAAAVSRTCRLSLACLALALAACGGDDDGGGTADASVAPDAAPAVTDRDIRSTALEFDVAAHTGRATIELAPGDGNATTFEVGDLDIQSVVVDGVDAPFSVDAGILQVGVDSAATTVVIDYAYTLHQGFEGAMTSGVTLVWPYYCGNLFPCDSDPEDGTTFTLELTGVPEGSVAVFPESIPADAPSYMIAWAIGAYETETIGTTADGTTIVASYLPGGLVAAMDGTENLVEAFEWLETTYGPYLFGDTAGTVAAVWGPGAFGGMEHHPLWHVASPAMSDQETQAHEAAHGWFGNGVRIACWEDFVLSEGTVSYLAARAMSETAGPAVGQLTWNSYQGRLDRLQAGAGNKTAWPMGCNDIDILGDGLFNDAPYMKGAFFYRALENRIGVEALDAALAAFYDEYAGKAAGMQDMLDTIEAMTGYDPSVCAVQWLRSEFPPDSDTCPE